MTADAGLVCVHSQKPEFRLRGLRLTDADPLAAFSEDERYWRYLSYGSRAPAQVEAFVRHAVAQSEKDGTREVWWALEEPSASALIGTANLKSLDRIPGPACSVGCTLAPDAQGRGLGPAVGWALICLAFERFHMASVECTCAVDNLGSQHTMRDTFTMTDAGDRESKRATGGPWRERVFTMTKSEFLANRLDIEDRLANSATSME